MPSFKCIVVLVSLLQLLSHGETKTIVFNSYATGPSAPGATLPKDETDAAARQETKGESSGRAFSSSDSVNGFPFSIHPNYLSKPVQVARPVDGAYQTPKYIYPSYSDSSRPYYDGPVAMDRFAPGEAYGGTIYKLKKQKLALQQGGGGGPFASIPAASFNSPVSVVAPTVLRPAASDNSPVNIPAPPGLSSGGPPPSPAMPSMDGPPSPPISAPTPNPSSGEDSSTSHPPGPIGAQMDSAEILLSPPNSHTGYLPPDKKASKPDASLFVRKSKPSSTVDSFHANGNDDLFKFPPNVNDSYPVPLGVLSKNPVTSYLPPPSGNTDSRANAESDTSANKATAELFKFPPNAHAGYLPPTSTDSKSHSDTSYLPPPSGDPSSLSNLKTIAKDAQIPGPTPKGELFKFPPNTDAAYLPPPLESGGSLKPLSDTSYLPPPSGDPNSLSNLKTMSKGAPIPGKSAAIPAAELYKFPPNSNAAYLPPSPDSSKSVVTSYLPPPSGNPSSPGMSSAMGSGPASAFKFPPNTNANYLPPDVMKLPKSHATSYLPPPSGNPNSNYYLHPPRPSPAQSYIPPASLFKFPPNINSQYLPANNSPPRPNNAVTSYLPPASGIPGDDTAGTIPVGPGKPQYLPPYYADSRPPPPPPAPMKMPTMPMMPMMPPPNMPMDGPPTGPTGMDHDHDHHHHHDFPYLSGFDHDHYPDIIYDHDHDHFHHHHDEPTTTPAPPPPPPPPVPETPRLKNYSYYYISRTLWYVPLYFTLYFCFYVTALILRSIARHKVNIPNEWTSNQRSLSSLADLSDAQTRQKATMLATFTMKQIEDFREKYL
ncbi:uncharacterized protein LOC128270750 [Anopheles cruzii]|uniref:uncharacterized protein LOC128270750 n=1 Tax=Anopheles cruzii TaxID=68878 RepID=UPI0022EC1C26|nr:uncharacterized protein LOC128270750 [Anopheles cruzii]